MSSLPQSPSGLPVVPIETPPEERPSGPYWTHNKTPYSECLFTAKPGVTLEVFQKNGAGPWYAKAWPMTVSYHNLPRSGHPQFETVHDAMAYAENYGK